MPGHWRDGIGRGSSARWRWCRVIGHWPDEADLPRFRGGLIIPGTGEIVGLGPGRKEGGELIQPAVGHDDVVVEKNEMLPARRLSPWLIAAGKPRLVVFVMTTTGTGAASCTPARYS